MLLDKIKIHDLSYVILLLSFFAGYFETVFLLMILIIVHEFGHFICALFLSKNVLIIIYPFGGITLVDSFLNDSILKELLIIITGPLLQILFTLFIFILYKNGFVLEEIYLKIKHLNLFLLSFNLLPILPLDGGKIINNILDIFLPYKLSHKLSIIISIFISILMILYFFNNHIFYIIILLLLIKNLIFEIIIFENKFNKFLVERTIYNFKYKYGKSIKSINKIKRNKKHKFIIYDNFIDEKEYLLNYYFK